MKLDTVVTVEEQRQRDIEQLARDLYVASIDSSEATTGTVTPIMAFKYAEAFYAELDRRRG